VHRRRRIPSTNFHAHDSHHVKKCRPPNFRFIRERPFVMPSFHQKCFPPKSAAPGHCPLCRCPDLLTVRAWTPGQYPTTLGYCITQRKQPASSLIDGTMAPTHLAFASFGQDSRLQDKRVHGKFPRSQHRPSLITPLKLKVPTHSGQVKRWKFRRADWKRLCLLTDESAEGLPPPDTSNIDRAYQDFC